MNDPVKLAEEIARKEFEKNEDFNFEVWKIAKLAAAAATTRQGG